MQSPHRLPASAPAELTEQELLTCVAAAVRAPSIHNTQPWQFLIFDGGVEVHADPARRLPAVDPQGRALHISLGAAVLNLRLAMACTGRRTDVRLLPDPGDPRHVATVRAAGPLRPTLDEIDLCQAIEHRHSNRRPFSDVAPPAHDLSALVAAAAAENAVLYFADPALRDALLSLARTVDVRHRKDPMYRAELRDWTTDDPYRDDGIPLTAIGPWSRDGSMPIRELAPDREIPGRGTERFEREPTVAVLSVHGGDDVLHWLRAGQALQRVLLEASRRGLAASLFTQPLEDHGMRELLRDPAHDSSVQAVLRVGYGEPMPPSPRRPLDDVVTRTRPVPLRPPHTR